MTALERPSPSTPLSAHPTFHDLAFPSAKKRALSGAPGPRAGVRLRSRAAAAGGTPAPVDRGEGTEPPCVKAEAGTDLQPPRGADAGLGAPVAGPTGALALYYTPETGNPQTE